MLKNIKTIISFVLICVIVCSFVACSSTLSGTYTNKDGIIEQSFIFEKDNIVKVSAFGVNIEGEYVIKDGEITITYNILGLKYDLVKSFEKKGNSIFIDGAEFIKE